MDSEKLNALCDEARLRTRDIVAKLAIVQNAKTDAGKLINLMFAMKYIRKLEKTKEQIENAEERIIRLDEVLLNFGNFEKQIRCLETLRERLNMEEEENDNQ